MDLNPNILVYILNRLNVLIKNQVCHLALKINYMLLKCDVVLLLGHWKFLKWKSRKMYHVYINRKKAHVTKVRQK